MCTHVQSDVLRVVRVLRVRVFQFCTCLWRHVFGVLGVLCVLLGLCVMCALCALYAFSKPPVQHCWPQKRASGQKRADGRQRNIPSVSRSSTLDSPGRQPYSFEVAQSSLRRRPAERFGGISKCTKMMLIRMMRDTLHAKYAEHRLHSF